MDVIFINRMMGVKFGGGENADLNFAIALSKRGHNVKFITAKSKKIKSPDLGDLQNIRIQHIQTQYFRKYGYMLEKSKIFKFLSPFFYELDLYIFEVKVYNYLKSNKINTDVFQICGLPRLAIRIKNKLNAKVVVRWPGKPGRTKIKYLLKYDYNIANGDVYKFLENLKIQNLKKVNIGVDQDLYSPKSIGKTTKGVSFLFLGRIVEIKNLPLLVKSFKDALKTLPNISLTIAGGGDEKIISRINSEIKNHFKIRYIGPVEKTDTPKLYNDHDVFLITSDYDNFPNTVLEALSSGLPVIGSDVGGISDQIQDKINGYLFKKGDALDLKEKIVEISKNSDLRTKMSVNARKTTITNFNWNSSAIDLEKIYL